jgi:DNA-binding NarL/FixJ family response regulator
MPILLAITDPGQVAKPGTLLIVDDSPAVCTALRAYMSRVEGWPTVLTAGDAAAGLDLAVAHAPAAIVLDNQMPPGPDGIDLLADLRHACPAARIVMHTSEDTVVLREKAVRLGADAIVAKGQPLDELAALINSAA